MIQKLMFFQVLTFSKIGSFSKIQIIRIVNLDLDL